MKPNLAFLRKVADGQVKSTFGYSTRRGGHYGFVGGEKTARAHEAAGYIKVPGASLGRPGIASLTEAGRAALAHSST